MAVKWIKTEHKGLRYYEHPTRKITKTGKLGRDASFPDRYYSIRYKKGDKDHSFGVGWLSDGIPDSELQKEPGLDFVAYCLKLLRQFKHNSDTGEGPTTPQERQEIIAAKVKADEKERARRDAEAITFGAFFVDTYLPQAEADKKPRSVEREKGLFKLWIDPAIGSKAMQKIMPLDLERLKKAMADGRQSPRSVEYALSVIRQVFNEAKRLGAFTGENPTAKVKFPKPDNARMRFLTRDEADQLLDALKGKSQDVHDMTLLSLHAGLRFGEIAALTWQDVNLEKGTLTIRAAKAGSRYAFLTEQAAAMLASRIKGNPADRVFPARGGQQIQIISHTFSRIVDELGFNKGIDDPRLRICFHSCRHSYASWMIEEGADLYTVQKLLGHKTGIMTQRYAHLSENRLKDAARALGAAWKDHAEAGQVVNFTK